MRLAKLGFCLLLCFTLMSGTVFATEEPADEGVDLGVNWIEGGGTVQIGELSSLQLDESLLFLDKADTEIVQEYFGNYVYGTELGSVFPADENESWFVLFEYEEEGYISDKDKDKINAKKLLKSYQDGTEESNKERAAEDQLFVKGWHTEPYYDEEDRTLVWALLAEDYYSNPLINYNVRILTREGYVSVLLVTDPTTLDHDINILKTLILNNYVINEGFRYEDHDPSTDKISEAGLTGLILGGAGLVAAKKAGLLVTLALLLKKFWFVLLAVPVAIWNWVKRRRASAAESAYVPVAPDASGYNSGAGNGAGFDSGSSGDTGTDASSESNNNNNNNDSR